MPRKKITGPATAAQVLDYFETASDVEVKLVASLVEGKLAKRFAPKMSATRSQTGGSVAGVTMPKPRAKKPAAEAAPANYGGETLQDA